MLSKYRIPEFWKSEISYQSWISKKASTHLKRDQNRGNTTATHKQYKDAIHQAVFECKGFDIYTGDSLEWSLIGKYNNKEAKEAKEKGENYKKKFAKLPTIDHVEYAKPNFKICSWEVNDAKNDLTLDGFIELCKKTIKHNS